VARAFVGLGANLGERDATMRRALDLLGATESIDVVEVSAFRETEPVGVVEQPRFLNAVAALDTKLAPEALLVRLLAIELELGRTREGLRFGPRTIDLDLLLYGEVVLEAPGLSLPHPRLHERRFVLEPLAELAPELVIPGRGRVKSLLAAVD